MKEVKSAGLQYLTEDLDRNLHALNAFFTIYVDLEHCGKDLNLSLLMKNNHKSDLLAASYFGTSTDGLVMLQGVQNKNLYQMVKFITENNLWAIITKKKRRFRFWQKKIVHDKRFSDVINALDELKDPELTKCLRSYPVELFAIAYTAVGLKGHEYLMSLQAAEAGRMAYRDFHTRVYKPKFVFLSKVKRFGGFIGLIFALWLILSSGILMRL